MIRNSLLLMATISFGPTGAASAALFGFPKAHGIHENSRKETASVLVK
jgi:hypothetical protein